MNDPKRGSAIHAEARPASVVIPTLNGGTLFRELLESLASQDVEGGIELLLHHLPGGPRLVQQLFSEGAEHGDRDLNGGLTALLAARVTRVAVAIGHRDHHHLVVRFEANRVLAGLTVPDVPRTDDAHAGGAPDEAHGEAWSRAERSGAGDIATRCRRGRRRRPSPGPAAEAESGARCPVSHPPARPRRRRTWTGSPRPT